MPLTRDTHGFFNRRAECEAIDLLLDEARRGASGALVIRGEPGIGKSTLLDHLSTSGSGCRVVRAWGVESEMELVFAGLQQMCASLLEPLASLPAPQRDGLSTAFGLASGETPDRFLVGLAVLALVRSAAADGPVICLVDDAQWVDQESLEVLGFVARRLTQDRIVMVFAVREPFDVPELAGLPVLPVGPLEDVHSRQLLEAAFPGRFEQAVRDRIVGEASGNPLALLEVPRSWTPHAFAGGYGLPDGAAVGSWIEESFRRRLRPLPEPTRLLLLVAASDPTDDQLVMGAAARRLGLQPDAAAPAAAVGLVSADPWLRFRHPMVRSVVYRDAAPQERRLVHAALAEAFTAESEADRRAWHRAQAAHGPDEGIALELERTAKLAQRRGGVAAAAAFLRKSTELTPDAVRRAERSLDAADLTYIAGAPADAEALLAAAEDGPLGELGRARSQLLRGRIAFTVSRGRDAPPLLLGAARRFEPLEPELARETYLEALTAAQFVGYLAPDGLSAVAEAAVAAPAGDRSRASNLLLDGFSATITSGPTAGAPILRRAVHAFRDGDGADTEGHRWLWMATAAALEVWDHESWRVLTERLVDSVRELGALAVLPLALSSSVAVHVFSGDLAEADSLLSELETVRHATGASLAPYGELMLATWRGDEAEVGELGDRMLRQAAERGEGVAVTTAAWAKALLYNSLGRYEDALAEASVAGDHPSGVGGPSEWVLPELVEAAARTGQVAVAEDALERFAERAVAAGTDWSLGILARSRAMLAEGSGADLHEEAVERLGRTRLAGEQGRAHLAFGEWLRRTNRRKAARQHLRAAHHVFESMGAHTFANRAGRELLATGETVRKRTVGVDAALTPQEEVIARLAAVGRSNSEIASQLFLSPRTVEWHLGKVFAKLRITSRNELGGRFDSRD